jgi:2-polyprenyl-3-methyl-5-hydroxy-6-metoxy-1,4-benzoquinol methylase
MNDSIWEKIYKENVWESGGSGVGSIPELALPWINLVNSFIEDKGVQSVLDLGSGDGRIFSRLKLRGARYTGIEASTEAISIFKKNNPEFSHDLINSNLVEASYPKSDLVLIKDVLQHNTDLDVFNILKKATESCKHLLICEDFTRDNFPDIVSGDWRPINFLGDSFLIKPTPLFLFGSLDNRYEHLKGVYLYSNP